MTLRKRSKKPHSKSTKNIIFFRVVTYSFLTLFKKIIEIKVCFLNVVYLLLPLSRLKKMYAKSWCFWCRPFRKISFE